MLCSIHGVLIAQNTTVSHATPVLVELFTSEGCSSCPPADLLLAKLEQLQPVKGADIIVLSEHVDYWEQGGWHDRFSSHQFTDRQTSYTNSLHVSNGDYTPQIVVDGTDQFIGNDASSAIRSITKASQTPKHTLTLSNVAVNGRRVSATLSGDSLPGKGDLYVVLVDALDTTDVKGGENSGHHLEHVDVARVMERIAGFKDFASGSRSFNLTLPSNANTGHMRLVAFAQQGDQRAVVGVVSAPLP